MANRNSGPSVAVMAIILAISIAAGMLAYAIIWLLMNFGAVMVPHILMGVGLIAIIITALVMLGRLSR